MDVTKELISRVSTHDQTSKRDDEEDHMLPPGFRFHPTDEELVGFYLKRKVEKKPIRIELIKHIDVYKHEPWDLPKLAGGDNGGEREWYFFCRRGRKYKNSIRPNRVTGSGFWKATGIDKPIYSEGEFHDCIGLKKSLVYYKGSAGKGTKTDWMMHEFRLPATKSSSLASPKNQEAEVWTLCRIFKREAPYKKYATDLLKFSSQKSYSDSSSKTSISRPDDGCRYKGYEVSTDDRLIERKPDVYDHFMNGSNQSIAGHPLSFTTPVPFMASYLGFSNQIGDEGARDGNWDELRPMVEFALDPPMLYTVLGRDII